MQYGIDDINRFVQRFYGTSRLQVTPFAYPFTYGALAAASALPTEVTVNIQANADFVATRFSYRVLQDTAATIVGKRIAGCVAMFRESGSKEPFTDRPIFLENYAQNGVNVRGGLAYPRFLAGGTDVTCELQNVSATDVGVGLEILMEGFLVQVFN